MSIKSLLIRLLEQIGSPIAATYRACQDGAAASEAMQADCNCQQARARTPPPPTCCC
jgi:hypothetical protein